MSVSEALRLAARLSGAAKEEIVNLWEPLAREVARVMLAEHDAGQLIAPPPPLPWTPPIPLGQLHELVHIDPVPTLTPQASTSSCSAGAATLYLLPVVRTTLLELIDGSQHQC